jgi:hypothetical protein
VPEGDIAPLLNHLVGAGEERLRDGKAERRGGLEIDDQLESRWLNDGEIGRCRSVQDVMELSHHKPHLFLVARAETDQPALAREL